LELGMPQVEVMAFYLKADSEMASGRFIDAYNDFYLFFETQFCKGTKKAQATASLLASSEFMNALGSA
jgi:hypothetical protein